MPTAEEEAWAATEAAPRDAEGRHDLGVYTAEYQRGLAERHERLKKDACASYRAMHGWANVASDEDWERIVLQADEDFGDGSFLLERLGAERYLDPPLAAVLLALRRRLVAEHGASTAAELLLIDSIVLSYYHQLRINGWLGDLAGWLEREFFALDSMTAKCRHGMRYPTQFEGGDLRGLAVEDIVQRIVEKLMPLLDRSNRMLIRNLKALKALREGPAPGVSIGSAGQVNVAAAQVNAMRVGEGERQGS